jgi:hypothetical protein
MAGVECVGGARSRHFFHQTEYQKQNKKTILALDGHRSKYYHTTTNQKHASVIDDGTKEWCKWSGTQGGVLCIVLVAIKKQYI